MALQLSRPGWQLLRDAAVPFVADPDFLTTQDLSTIDDAVLDVPNNLDTSEQPIKAVRMLAKSLTDGGVIADAGTVTVEVLEVVTRQPPHIVDTGVSATLTVGAVTNEMDISLALATALGSGRYVLRLSGSAGLTGDTLRLYVKAV